jgi:hypothetical protein
VAKQTSVKKPDAAADKAKPAELEATLAGTTDAVMVDHCKTRIAEVKKASAATVTPSVCKFMLESMKEQKQHVVVLREKIVAAAEKSRLSAIERQMRFGRAMNAQLEELQQKILAFNARVVVVNNQHTDAIAAKSRNQDALLAEWEKQITQVALLLPGGGFSASIFVSDEAPAGSFRPLTPMQELVQKQATDAAAAVAAAEAAVVAADSAAAASAAAQTAAAVIAAQHLANDYYLKAAWDEETVAKLKVKDMVVTERDSLHWLSCAMVQWSQHGMCQITYANLFGDPADSTQFMATLRSLGGSGYWSELYGSRSLAASDVVPQQLHAVITASLPKSPRR